METSKEIRRELKHADENMQEFLQRAEKEEDEQRRALYNEWAVFYRGKITALNFVLGVKE